MPNDFKVRRARELIRKGLDFVNLGKTREARREFLYSARLFPTAESYTYWAWMEFHLGHAKRAILLCQEAIKRDPDFGNPYNDVGSYLVSMGKIDEAIPWFERAISSKRYQPRQFPHINLGRIYLSRRDYSRALREFELALRWTPEDQKIIEAIQVAQQHLAASTSRATAQI